jgi:hypothetical protein
LSVATLTESLSAIAVCADGMGQTAQRKSSETPFRG